MTKTFLRFKVSSSFDTHSLSNPIMPRDFVLRIPGRARQRPESSKGLDPAALAARVHGVAGAAALDFGSQPIADGKTRSILPLGGFKFREMGLVRFPSALSPMLTFGDSAKGNTTPHALSVSSRRSGALTMPPVADGSGVSPVAVQTRRDSPPALAGVQLAGRVRLVAQTSRLAGFVEPKELGRGLRGRGNGAEAEQLPRVLAAGRLNAAQTQAATSGGGHTALPSPHKRGSHGRGINLNSGGENSVLNPRVVS